MATTRNKQKSLFVLLPSLNVWNAAEPGDAARFLRTASLSLKRAPGNRPAKVKLVDAHALQVIDEVAPHESMLVAMTEAELVHLARTQPGLRVVPVVELKPLWLPRYELTPIIAPMRAAKRLTYPVSVMGDDTGEPISGVDVYAFTDRAAQTGASAVTGKDGVAKISLPSSVKDLDVLEVAAADGFWPTYLKAVKVTASGVELRCRRIDLRAPDARDHFSLRGSDTDGQGVVVGVIDTGVTRHRDLVIAKGVNVVKGEPVGRFGDQLGHGTHVCGIIAGKGAPGIGVRGVAPAVQLHVYKVFGKDQETAASFNIAKAIRQAVDDGCDLINMSLGADSDMPDVLREIQRARAMGVVCLAATGNDYRAPVGYPARYSQVVAVAALGRKKTYPKAATQELSAMAPFGQDGANYVADFSNVGGQVGLIEPGVGIVSTCRGGYVVMDGTSMACPVATGALARFLAAKPRILAMVRDQKRSDAIVKLALTTAIALGLGATFEGSGILR